MDSWYGFRHHPCSLFVAFTLGETKLRQIYAVNERAGSAGKQRVAREAGEKQAGQRLWGVEQKAMPSQKNSARIRFREMPHGEKCWERAPSCFALNPGSMPTGTLESSATREELAQTQSGNPCSEFTNIQSKTSRGSVYFSTFGLGSLSLFSGVSGCVSAKSTATKLRRNRFFRMALTPRTPHKSEKEIQRY